MKRILSLEREIEQPPQATAKAKPKGKAMAPKRAKKPNAAKSKPKAANPNSAKAKALPTNGKALPLTKSPQPAQDSVLCKQQPPQTGEKPEAAAEKEKEVVVNRMELGSQFSSPEEENSPKNESTEKRRSGKRHKVPQSKAAP